MVGIISYFISYVYYVFGFICCVSVDLSNDLFKIFGILYFLCYGINFNGGIFKLGIFSNVEKFF